MTDSMDILVKLFDTLKEASDESKKNVQVLVSQQQELVNYIKLLPIAELRDNLKDHSKQSGTDINTCAQKVETNSKNILDKVRSIDGKLNKMLIIASVIFSLLGVAYFIARSTTDVEQIKKEIIKDVEAQQAKEHKDIIEAVERAMKTYKDSNNPR
jgi:predicted PurR-regulated permease PerM